VIHFPQESFGSQRLSSGFKQKPPEVTQSILAGNRDRGPEGGIGGRVGLGHYEKRSQTIILDTKTAKEPDCKFLRCEID